MSRPFAQLIEDGGASAVGGVGGHPSEFFRGAHFLAAERATHTLRIELDDAELLAPLLVREIGDDVRGKGVGRRAEALTIKKAFDEFGAHRVYGRIPARNEIAKKTVASQGWVYEGTMRGHLARRGEPADDCEIWGVLPDEFRAATADLFGE